MGEHVVLDIEVQRTIGGPDGITFNDTHLLGVSVAVLYDMASDHYAIYGASDLDALRARLDAAERITTWNGETFDLPVIYGLKRPRRVAHLEPANDDLLQRVWMVLDHFEKGWKLDDVARAMLGRCKTGSGDLAPLLYQQGRWVELINYCVNDMHLLRDILILTEATGVIEGASGQKVTLPPWRSTHVVSAEPMVRPVAAHIGLSRRA